jgi:hypothetical protein
MLGCTRLIGRIVAPCLYSQSQRLQRLLATASRGYPCDKQLGLALQLMVPCQPPKASQSQPSATLVLIEYISLLV